MSKKNKKDIASNIAAVTNSKFLTPRSACIFLSVLTFVLFGNTLFNDFTLDDAIVITDNEFTQKGIGGIADIFTKDSFHGFFGEAGKDKLVSGGRYRPLTIAMFAIEKAIFGNGPFFHHLINILLYSLSGIIVFLIGLNLFGKNYNPNKSFFLALAMASLFIAHPLHTEAVANIKGRDEIMALLMSLTALFVLTRKSFKQLSATDYLLASLFLFCGLMSKENAITFTLVIPLAAYIFYGKTFKESSFIALPFIGTAIIFLIIRTMVIGWDLGSSPSNEFMNNPYLKIVNNQYVAFSTSEKFATISFTLFKYLQLLFFPYPLTHDYYPNHVSLKTFANPIALLGILSYVGLSALSIWGMIKRKIWSFFTSYYLVTISIVSNIIFPIGTHMSERFLYMPSIAFCGLLSLLIFRLLEAKTSLKFMTLSGIVLIYAFITINRNTVWKDNYTLFTTDALVSKESAKVNNAAGGAIGDKIKDLPDGPEKTALIEKAHFHLSAALNTHPNYVNAYLLKGNAYFYENKYDEAIQQYDQCLRIDPEYTEARTNKLISLRAAGRYQGEKMNNLALSLNYLQKAYALDSNDFETNRLLGTCLGIMGKHEEAIKYFIKCTELDPNNATLFVSIGKAYEFMGNTQAALESYNTAKKIDPNINI